jgi:hypothetical protein
VRYWRDSTDSVKRWGWTGVLALVIVAPLALVGEGFTGQGDGRGTAVSGGAALGGLTPAQERLLALAPSTDLLVLLDLRRVLDELLPQLVARKVAGVDALANGWAATGLSLAKGGDALLTLSWQGLEAGGLLLVEGADLDLGGLEPLLAANPGTFRKETRQGIDLWVVLTPVKPPTLGPLVLSTEDLTLALLGNGRLALGNRPALIALLDRLSAGPAIGAGLSSPLVGALRQTPPTSLLRFALQLPPSVREEAANQGDLFRSLGLVETIRGGLDMTPDLALLLEAFLPTTSQKEAAELNLGLRGLLNLVRALFASSGEPQTSNQALLTQVLNRLTFAVRGLEVSLQLTLPPDLLWGTSQPDSPPLPPR